MTLTLRCRICKSPHLQILHNQIWCPTCDLLVRKVTPQQAAIFRRHLPKPEPAALEQLNLLKGGEL